MPSSGDPQDEKRDADRPAAAPPCSVTTAAAARILRTAARARARVARRARARVARRASTHAELVGDEPAFA
jgi:hypothetical protein